MVGLGRWALRNVLRLAYGVRVTGLEHYAAAGQRVLIVANHTSFLDAALLAAFLPDRLTFAINTEISKRWWIKPLLKIVDAFPLNPTNPYSLKSLIRYIEQDKRAAIFPEGRITVTGSLMKIYPGPGLVADKSRAMVLPIRIDGAQYTPFSRLRGRVRLRLFPQITLTIMPPRRLEVPASVRGRERRRVAGKLLADLMTEMMFATSNYRRTVFGALLDARRVHGGRHVIVEDVERAPLTYNQLLVRALLLGGLVANDTRRGEAVGVMLPNAIACVATFFGLQAYGRVPAMLNYTLGAKSVLASLPGGADPPHLHVGALRRRREARASRRQAPRGRDRRLPRGRARAHHAVAQDQGRRSRAGLRRSSILAAVSCPTSRPSCCSRRARRECRKVSRCRTPTCSRTASRSRRASISARRT